MTAVLEYSAVQDYLFGLKAGGPRFGIDRMRALAAALGHPEAAMPVVHVAGTNGKGSVSAMIEAMLRASGLRVGLYTSPHLVRLGERVQVDRQLLTEAEICSYVAELRPIAERLAAVDEGDRPSFFEFMTGMAFLQFQRRRCDVAVIEVGLGGRLDATNVVDPAVAVITSIGLDHVELLGDTLGAIAGEKAGIIKPGRPVVMGRVPPEAEEVIRAKAQQVGARIVSVREEFGEDLAAYPRTNLEGDYQRWNAATALLAVRKLKAPPALSPARAAAALLAVDWPGRWQRMSVGGRRVILDASHNPEGVTTLDANLRRLRAELGVRPVIALGALGEARARAVIEVAARHAAEIRLLVPHQSRASGYDELEALVPGNFSGRVVRDTVEAVFPSPNVCTIGAPGDTIVVTGSIYLLGEVLTLLEPQRGPGEGRLQDF
ncbi:MAG TPA: folylpolyglutamate synthase/dihydrofolate synthase family protein [Opitutaceae bacterium]|nr:folylpolyglutamate synthase/dihydrofolate synthase family protein [Opitutaceae bacterium]